MSHATTHCRLTVQRVSPLQNRHQTPPTQALRRRYHPPREQLEVSCAQRAQLGRVGLVRVGDQDVMYPTLTAVVTTVGTMIYISKTKRKKRKNNHVPSSTKSTRYSYTSTVQSSAYSCGPLVTNSYFEWSSNLIIYIYIYVFIGSLGLRVSYSFI